VCGIRKGSGLLGAAGRDHVFTMVVFAFNKRRGYIRATARFHGFVDRVEDLGNISFGFNTSKNNSPL
jgi:hypothetical protein